jgi:hypothetical protein
MRCHVHNGFIIVDVLQFATGCCLRAIQALAMLYAVKPNGYRCVDAGPYARLYPGHERVRGLEGLQTTVGISIGTENISRCIPQGGPIPVAV